LEREFVSASHVLEDNEIAGNGGDDVEIFTDLIDEIADQQDGLRRDAAGSSFRITSSISPTENITWVFDLEDDKGWLVKQKDVAKCNKG
jgi:hypothetical protein